MLNQITTNFDEVEDDEKRSSWEILVVLRWGERKWLELNDVSALGFSQGRCFRSIHNRVSHRNWRYLKQSLFVMGHIIFYIRGSTTIIELEQVWRILNEFKRVWTCYNVVQYYDFLVCIYNNFTFNFCETQDAMSPKVYKRKERHTFFLGCSSIMMAENVPMFLSTFFFFFSRIYKYLLPKVLLTSPNTFLSSLILFKKILYLWVKSDQKNLNWIIQQLLQK